MEQTSILGYFLGAGGVVKAVMFILLLASIVSWTLIFQRAWYFKQKKKAYDNFEATFQSCSDLNTLYRALEANASERTGLAAIFYAGFKAFSQGEPPAFIERVMSISHAKEEAALEEHLPWFASIGSIAPFVGLFGTVWGIMTSFQALGQAQQATIAMVAPGISEALVATALGLFTAIPAVIAFNRYGTSAARLLDSYDIFQEELMALMTRSKDNAKA